jgi:phosphopantetheinyl transferase
MGDLSQIGPDGRLAVTIPVAPHWVDHRFQGRAVLPAVEALQLLARWAQEMKPGLHVQHLRNAAFDKFLELPPAGESIAAWCEPRMQPNGALRMALLTKTQAKSAQMTRAKIHAQVDFYPQEVVPPPAALDLAAALAGRCFTVDPEALYRDLVPFGPGFRTIARPLLVTAEGALALIDAPGGDPPDAPLGAPRVLDAALHAACVWSQRQAGIVAFPVGFDQRMIVRPTRPGDTYASRIFPLGTDEGVLIFDIWIVDLQGEAFEILHGVRMRDVSGGALQPPDWVRAGRGHGGLETLAAACAATVLIERATLMPFAERCLSETERRRTVKMSPKRRTDFYSSRLACKRLFRELTGDQGRTPAAEIHTLADDGIRPIAGASRFHCSVAHDRRFTLAVAANGPIGVDVERVADRILKSLPIFADDAEQALVAASPLGPVPAAARIWTIKESAAKMLNIHLADAWARVRVLAVGLDESRVAIAAGPAVAVRHVALDDHLITVLHPV